MGKRYTVAIIGSGPGGYVAAIRAAQLGMSVCLVEKELVGGVCLNWGCIPTKTLLHSAHLFQEFNDAASLGIQADNIRLDFSALQRRKESVVTQLRGGIESILKKRGVDLLYGQGRLTGKNVLEVNGTPVEYEHCIIAVGSRAAEVPGIRISEQEGIVSNKGMLAAGSVPRRLLIIGGGAIGCEFADMFASCGSEVRIIELAEQMLPAEDPDAVRMLAVDFKKKGIAVLTKTGVTQVSRNPDATWEATLTSGQQYRADMVLVAAGRKPNIEGCGIAESGIAVNRGTISVNEYMQTNVPGIYAIGDVVGKTFLAHTASREGMVAVERIAGMNSTMQYEYIPRCIYTHMQIAGVGLSEVQAREKGIAVKIGKFPFTASGKAIIDKQPRGMIKLIAEAASGRLVGAVLCGPGVTELVHELCVALQSGFTARQLSQVIHAHPTLSETIMEAAESIHSQAIHIF
jgi:dihydrolipoamide dehydrogenase